jgi:Zn-dependent protease
LTSRCPDCGTPWAPETLACPRCRRLVHAERLRVLADEARALEASDENAAIARWQEAVALLPPAAKQRATIEARILSLTGEAVADAANARANKKTPKWIAALGGVGLVLWKLKVVLVFVATKAKLLLLGLTKWKTALSMLVFLGVYWTAFGWPFALGFVLSIYVHEMGHVAELRRRGLPASAPMFIPGLGAFVRLKQAPRSTLEDARIGLAGPWWGLGAAVSCFLVYQATDITLFAALAQTGAWINLFNMIPIWQLDGGRAFRALSRPERWAAAVLALVAWGVSQESMLLLVLLAALFRGVVGPFDERGDRRGLVAYAILLALLTALVMVDVPGTR